MHSKPWVFFTLLFSLMVGWAGQAAAIARNGEAYTQAAIQIVDLKIANQNNPTVTWDLVDNGTYSGTGTRIALGDGDDGADTLLVTLVTDVGITLDINGNPLVEFTMYDDDTPLGFSYELSNPAVVVLPQSSAYLAQPTNSTTPNGSAYGYTGTDYVYILKMPVTSDFPQNGFGLNDKDTAPTSRRFLPEFGSTQTITNGPELFVRIYNTTGGINTRVFCGVNQAPAQTSAGASVVSGVVNNHLVFDTREPQLDYDDATENIYNFNDATVGAATMSADVGGNVGIELGGGAYNNATATWTPVACDFLNIYVEAFDQLDTLESEGAGSHLKATSARLRFYRPGTDTFEVAGTLVQGNNNAGPNLSQNQAGSYGYGATANFGGEDTYTFRFKLSNSMFTSNATEAWNVQFIVSDSAGNVVRTPNGLTAADVNDGYNQALDLGAGSQVLTVANPPVPKVDALSAQFPFADNVGTTLGYVTVNLAADSLVDTTQAYPNQTLGQAVNSTTLPTYAQLNNTAPTLAAGANATAGGSTEFTGSNHLNAGVAYIVLESSYGGTYGDFFDAEDGNDLYDGDVVSTWSGAAEFQLFGVDATTSRWSGNTANLGALTVIDTLAGKLLIGYGNTGAELTGLTNQFGWLDFYYPATDTMTMGGCFLTQKIRFRVYLDYEGGRLDTRTAGGIDDRANLWSHGSPTHPLGDSACVNGAVTFGFNLFGDAGQTQYIGQTSEVLFGGFNANYSDAAMRNGEFEMVFSTTDNVNDAGGAFAGLGTSGYRVGSYGAYETEYEAALANEAHLFTLGGGSNSQIVLTSRPNAFPSQRVEWFNPTFLYDEWQLVDVRDLFGNTIDFGASGPQEDGAATADCAGGNCGTTGEKVYLDFKAPTIEDFIITTTNPQYAVSTDMNRDADDIINLYPGDSIWVGIATDVALDYNSTGTAPNYGDVYPTGSSPCALGFFTNGIESFVQFDNVEDASVVVADEQFRYWTFFGFGTMGGVDVNLPFANQDTIWFVYTVQGPNGPRPEIPSVYDISGQVATSGCKTITAFDSDKYAPNSQNCIPTLPAANNTGIDSVHTRVRIVFPPKLAEWNVYDLNNSNCVNTHVTDGQPSDSSDSFLGGTFVLDEGSGPVTQWAIMIGDPFAEDSIDYETGMGGPNYAGVGDSVLPSGFMNALSVKNTAVSDDSLRSYFAERLKWNKIDPSGVTQLLGGSTYHLRFNLLHLLDSLTFGDADSAEEGVYRNIRVAVAGPDSTRFDIYTYTGVGVSFDEMGYSPPGFDLLFDGPRVDFALDRTAPQTDIVTPPSFAHTDYSGLFWTNDSTAWTINFSSNDPKKGDQQYASGVKMAQLFVRTPGSSVFTFTGLASDLTAGSFTYDVPNATVGRYQFLVHATDCAGNFEADTSLMDTLTVYYEKVASDGNNAAGALQLPMVLGAGCNQIDAYGRDRATANGDTMSKSYFDIGAMFRVEPRDTNSVGSISLLRPGQGGKVHLYYRQSAANSLPSGPWRLYSTIDFQVPSDFDPTTGVGTINDIGYCNYTFPFDNDGNAATRTDSVMAVRFKVDVTGTVGSTPALRGSGNDLIAAGNGWYQFNIVFEDEAGNLSDIVNDVRTPLTTLVFVNVNGPVSVINDVQGENLVCNGTDTLRLNGQAANSGAFVDSTYLYVCVNCDLPTELADTTRWDRVDHIAGVSLGTAFSPRNEVRSFGFSLDNADLAAISAANGNVDPMRLDFETIAYGSGNHAENDSVNGDGNPDQFVSNYSFVWTTANSINLDVTSTPPADSLVNVSSVNFVYHAAITGGLSTVDRVRLFVSTDNGTTFDSVATTQYNNLSSVDGNFIYNFQADGYYIFRVAAYSACGAVDTVWYGYCVDMTDPSPVVSLSGVTGRHQMLNLVDDNLTVTVARNLNNPACEGDNAARVLIYYQTPNGGWTLWQQLAAQATDPAVTFDISDLGLLYLNGTYSFYAVVMDTAGNVGTSQVVSVGADFDQPEVVFVSMHDTKDSCEAALAGYTNQDSVLINLVASPDVDSLIFAGDANPNPQGIPFSSGSRPMIRLTTGDGVKNVTVRAMDIAGNSGTLPDSTASIILDQTAPVYSISAMNRFIVPKDSGFVNITINGTETNPRYVEVWASYNRGTWYQVARLNDVAPAGGITYPFGALQGDGIYYIATRGIDAAGNCEDIPLVAEDSVMFDRTAPISDIVTPTVEDCDETATLRFAFTDFFGSGVDTLRLWMGINNNPPFLIDSIPYNSLQAGFTSGQTGFVYGGFVGDSTQGQFTAGFSVQDLVTKGWLPATGAFILSFYVTSEDDAKNVEQLKDPEFTFRFDRQDPVVRQFRLAGNGLGDSLYSEGMVAVDAQVQDEQQNTGVNRIEWKVRNITYGGTFPAQGGGTDTVQAVVVETDDFTSEPFALVSHTFNFSEGGIYELSFDAFDMCGNVTTSDTLTVWVDMVNPEAMIVSNPTYTDSTTSVSRTDVGPGCPTGVGLTFNVDLMDDFYSAGMHPSQTQAGMDSLMDVWYRLNGGPWMLYSDTQTTWAFLNMTSATRTDSVSYSLPDTIVARTVTVYTRHYTVRVPLTNDGLYEFQVLAAGDSVGRHELYLNLPFDNNGVEASFTRDCQQPTVQIEDATLNGMCFNTTSLSNDSIRIDVPVTVADHTVGLGSGPDTLYLYYERISPSAPIARTLAARVHVDAGFSGILTIRIPNAANAGDGYYQVSARTKDEAGNWSGWSNAPWFRIDTRAPQFPATPAVWANQGAVTIFDEPIIPVWYTVADSFMAVSGIASVQLYYAWSDTADVTGQHYSDFQLYDTDDSFVHDTRHVVIGDTMYFDISRASQSGFYKFAIVATDSCGNVSAMSPASAPVLIDVVVPMSTVDADPIDPCYGTTPPVSNTITVNIQGWSAESDLVGINLYARFEGSDTVLVARYTPTRDALDPNYWHVNTTVTVNTLLNLSFNGNTGRQGEYGLITMAVDVAGNLEPVDNQTSDVTFFVDTTAPVIANFSAPDLSDDHFVTMYFTAYDMFNTGSSPQDMASGIVSAELNFRKVLPVAHLTDWMHYDERIYAQVDSVTGAFVFDASSRQFIENYGDGTYEFRLDITDFCGNVVSDTEATIVDTRGPNTQVRYLGPQCFNANPLCFQYYLEDGPASSGLDTLWIYGNDSFGWEQLQVVSVGAGGGTIGGGGAYIVDPILNTWVDVCVTLPNQGRWEIVGLTIDQTEHEEYLDQDRFGNFAVVFDATPPFAAMDGIPPYITNDDGLVTITYQSEDHIVAPNGSPNWPNGTLPGDMEALYFIVNYTPTLPWPVNTVGIVDSLQKYGFVIDYDVANPNQGTGSFTFDVDTQIDAHANCSTQGAGDGIYYFWVVAQDCAGNVYVSNTDVNGTTATPSDTTIVDRRIGYASVSAIYGTTGITGNGQPQVGGPADDQGNLCNPDTLVITFNSNTRFDGCPVNPTVNTGRDWWEVSGYDYVELWRNVDDDNQGMQGWELADTIDVNDVAFSGTYAAIRVAIPTDLEEGHYLYRAVAVDKAGNREDETPYDPFVDASGTNGVEFQKDVTDPVAHLYNVAQYQTAPFELNYMAMDSSYTSGMAVYLQSKRATDSWTTPTFTDVDNLSNIGSGNLDYPVDGLYPINTGLANGNKWLDGVWTFAFYAVDSCLNDVMSNWDSTVVDTKTPVLSNFVVPTNCDSVVVNPPAMNADDRLDGDFDIWAKYTVKVLLNDLNDNFTSGGKIYLGYRHNDGETVWVPRAVLEASNAATNNKPWMWNLGETDANAIADGAGSLATLTGAASVVTITDNDAALSTNAVYEFQFNPFASYGAGDGEYTFIFKAVDNAGNSSPEYVGNTVAWTVDVVSPNATMESFEAEFVTDENVAIEYDYYDGNAGDYSSDFGVVQLWYAYSPVTVPNPDVRNQYRLYATQTTPTGSFMFNAGAPGYYCFEVVAFDGCGNTDADPNFIQAGIRSDMAPGASLTIPNYDPQNNPEDCITINLDRPVSQVYAATVGCNANPLPLVPNPLVGTGPMSLVSAGNEPVRIYNEGVDSIYLQVYARTPVRDQIKQIQLWYRVHQNCEANANYSLYAVVDSKAGSQSNFNGMWYHAFNAPGNIADSAWTTVFRFPFVEGDGLYQFYTVTVDSSGNTEVPPLGYTADLSVIYDTEAPMATIDAPDFSTNGNLYYDLTYMDDTVLDAIQNCVGSGVDTIQVWAKYDCNFDDVWDTQATTDPALRPGLGPTQMTDARLIYQYIIPNVGVLSNGNTEVRDIFGSVLGLWGNNPIVNTLDMLHDLNGGYADTTNDFFDQALLPDGNYRLWIRVSDRACHWTTTDSVNTTLNRLKPASFVSDDFSEPVNPDSTDAHYNDAIITIPYHSYDQYVNCALTEITNPTVTPANPLDVDRDTVMTHRIHKVSLYYRVATCNTLMPPSQVAGNCGQPDNGTNRLDFYDWLIWDTDSTDAQVPGRIVNNQFELNATLIGQNIFTRGEGVYQLFTVATDTAGNVEPWPNGYQDLQDVEPVPTPGMVTNATRNGFYSQFANDWRIAQFVVDFTPPTSVAMCGPDSMMIFNTSMDTVWYNAEDYVYDLNGQIIENCYGSGVRIVNMWYRHDANNDGDFNDPEDHPTWRRYGSDTEPDCMVIFDAHSAYGNGRYEIEFVAEDYAGNIESRYGRKECEIIVDNVMPFAYTLEAPDTLLNQDSFCPEDATCKTIPYYANAAAATSGLSEVRLYYRVINPNSNTMTQNWMWYATNFYREQDNVRTANGTFNFCPPAGMDGLYQFELIAATYAPNVEYDCDSLLMEPKNNAQDRLTRCDLFRNNVDFATPSSQNSDREEYWFLIDRTDPVATASVEDITYCNTFTVTYAASDTGSSARNYHAGLDYIRVFYRFNPEADNAHLWTGSMASYVNTWREYPSVIQVEGWPLPLIAGAQAGQNPNGTQTSPIISAINRNWQFDVINAWNGTGVNIGSDTAAVTMADGYYEIALVAFDNAWDRTVVTSPYSTYNDRRNAENSALCAKYTYTTEDMIYVNNRPNTPEDLIAIVPSHKSNNMAEFYDRIRLEVRPATELDVQVDAGLPMNGGGYRVYVSTVPAFNVNLVPAIDVPFNSMLAYDQTRNSFYKEFQVADGVNTDTVYTTVGGGTYIFKPNRPYFFAIRAYNDMTYCPDWMSNIHTASPTAVSTRNKNSDVDPNTKLILSPRSRFEVYAEVRTPQPLWAGWNMVTTPVQSVSGAMATGVTDLYNVFEEAGQPTIIKWWNEMEGEGWPGNYFNVGQLTEGRGYFLYSFNEGVQYDWTELFDRNPKVVQYTRTEATEFDLNHANEDDVDNLMEGWNLVGNNLPVPIYYKHSEPGAFSRLSTIWLNGTENTDYEGRYYQWDGSQYQYWDGTNGEIDGQTNMTDMDGSIDPGDAFWVHVLNANNRKMTIRRANIAPLAVMPRTNDDASWMLQLAANTPSFRDNYNYIGVNANAENGYDMAYDARELTPMTLVAEDGQGLMTYFTADNVTLTADVRQTIADNEAMTWQMTVAAVNINEPVTLTWPNIASVPANYTVMLKDLATGELIDLRTHGAYTFTPTVTTGIALDQTDPTLPAGVADETARSFEVIVSNGRVSAELASFLSAARMSDLLLTWTTASEADHAGFNVYRSEGESVEFTKINSTLLVSANKTYEFADANVTDGATYTYVLKAVDTRGLEAEAGRLSATYHQPEAMKFALEANYPNPFNPSTTIAFSLAAAGHTTLKIYNASGQLVRTLLNGKVEAGRHTAIWDGRNDQNQAATSGVYFYVLESGNQSATNKMIMLK